MRTKRVLLISSGRWLLLNVSLIKRQTEGPTVFHWDWKKPTWSPSTPGALRGFMLKIVFLISMSSTGLWSIWNMVSPIIGKQPVRGYCKKSLSSLSYKREKKWTSCFLISTLSKSYCPASSLIAVIRFLLLLVRVFLWKKVVLRSPWRIQSLRDFWCQKLSSWSTTSSSSCFKLNSSRVRLLELWLSNTLWMPPNRAKSLLFLWKMFPKDSS